MGERVRCPATGLFRGGWSGVRTREISVARSVLDGGNTALISRELREGGDLNRSTLGGTALSGPAATRTT